MGRLRSPPITITITTAGVGGEGPQFLLFFIISADLLLPTVQTFWEKNGQNRLFDKRRN